MARSSKSSNGSTKQPDKAKDTSEDDTANATGETAPEVKETESVEVETAAAETEASGDLSDPDPEPETEEPPSEEVAEEAVSEVPGVVPASVETLPPPPPQPVKASGPGALGIVLGGLVAGAIGFLVATFAIPEGWPNPEPSGLDVLQSSVTEQGDRLEGLAAEIAAVREAAPGAPGADIAPLAERIESLDAQIADAAAALGDGLAGLDSRLTEIETRLAELESRPTLPAGADGSAAMEAQLDEFRQQLDAVTADAEARIAEAQDRASEIEAKAAATAAEAERAAALSSLRVALDNGTPFSDTLIALPDALATVAADGVPTLGSLQSGFPDAAREALSRSQTVPEAASAGDRIVALLKRRTNARSLSPREGDDADAVLSRAEAAVGSGDLGTALTELAALPEAAREAMSGWIAMAETRMAALSAFAALETETK